MQTITTKPLFGLQFGWIFPPNTVKDNSLEEDCREESVNDALPPAGQIEEWHSRRDEVRAWKRVNTGSQYLRPRVYTE